MKRRFASLLGALVLLTGAVMMAGCPQSAKPDIQKYKITLKAGDHGTIAANPVLPKDGMVEQYTTLTFTATPNADYETEWAGAVPDADDKNKATLTVTADTMVTVTFKKRGSAAPGGNGQATETPNGFHIALSSGEHGSVQADSALPADGIVAKDTVLTFTAMPDTGYEVAAWTGATQDSADKNKARLTVTAHTTVSVTFKEKAADVSLLQIDYYGNLTGVTDRNALVGSLAIPNTVTKIGAGAFVDCSKLTSVTMPETVTEIGYGAFLNCSALSAVTISNNVTKIGDAAFAHCTNLTGITIPDNVTKIGVETFARCTNLTGITIPDSVTEIGNLAFSNCSALSTVTIGTGITKIGDAAFIHCTNLTGITIPDSVTEIGARAFSDCSALSAVTIGTGITKIESNAFLSCLSLGTITIKSSVLTDISNDAFSGIKSDAQFTVKTEAVKTLLNTRCNIEESKITVDENL